MRSTDRRTRSRCDDDRPAQDTGKGPLHDVVVGGMHLHHLVLGILLLLGAGYLWLAQVGTGVGRSLDWPSRLTALLLGVGAALTLDEFALWLRLEDV